MLRGYPWIRSRCVHPSFLLLLFFSAFREEPGTDEFGHREIAGPAKCRRRCRVNLLRLVWLWTMDDPRIMHPPYVLHTR